MKGEERGRGWIVELGNMEGEWEAYRFMIKGGFFLNKKNHIISFHFSDLVATYPTLSIFIPISISFRSGNLDRSSPLLF